MHGSTTSNGLAVPNDEDGEYTPPLVLCLVTNTSKAAFQPRCRLSCISRKAVSAFPDINIDSVDTILTITLPIVAAQTSNPKVFFFFDFMYVIF